MTAPTSLWDMSTTSASNTSVQGNSIAESCAPSGINDAIRAVVAQALGAVKEVTASGTDTYTATLAPAPDALSDGMTVRIRFTNANATTTPNLNINSLGAKTITKFGGAALVAGDIPAGHDGDLTYVSSGTTWQLKNPKIGVVAGTGVLLSTQTVSLDPSYLRGYLSGLTLSNDGGTPNSVLDVAAGVCVDSTNATLIKLTAFTKTTATPWASGTGNAGMGSGLTIANNTWYHVFAIINNGSADVYFDTSASGANAPASTTAFRRIGSFKTAAASTNIVTFNQVGDKFEWKVPIVDINAVTPTSAAQNTITVTVPTNIVTEAIVSAQAGYASGAATGLLIYPTNLTSAPAISSIVASVAGNVFSTSNLRVTTNGGAPAQIFTKLTYGGSTTYSLETLGWVDTRGRFA